VQTLANHKYVGHFAMLVYYVAGPVDLRARGEPQSARVRIHADAPVLGHEPLERRRGAWAWYALFWGGVAVLLAIVSNLFWTRGEERGRGWRMRLARMRATRPVLAAAGIAGALVLGTVGFILYNTTVPEPAETDSDKERVRVEYERRYKRFEWAPQPRVTAVKLHVELFPRAEEMRARGSYTLRNAPARGSTRCTWTSPAACGSTTLAFDGRRGGW
jgi:hypothetical protein